MFDRGARRHSGLTLPGKESTQLCLVHVIESGAVLVTRDARGFAGPGMKRIGRIDAFAEEVFEVTVAAVVGHQPDAEAATSHLWISSGFYDVADRCLYIGDCAIENSRELAQTARSIVAGVQNDAQSVVGLESDWKFSKESVMTLGVLDPRESRFNVGIVAVVPGYIDGDVEVIGALDNQSVT